MNTKKPQKSLLWSNESAIINIHYKTITYHKTVTKHIIKFKLFQLSVDKKALCAASSSTFWHLDFIRAVDGLVQLTPWCILKDRQLCLHKYVKYWIPLSLRQNKSRYNLWPWLELGCFCKCKQSINKEI